MRNGLVPATHPVPMALVMSGTAVFWSADVWICRTHLQNMFVEMPSMRRMQMAFVNVVQIILVANNRMTTTHTMDVPVASMSMMNR